MKTYRVALYPGDGIGPEVLDQAMRVLEALQERSDWRLETTCLDWGGDYYRRHGRVAPEDFLQQLRPFDAILLGALGDPQRIPDHLTLDPLMRMRQGFDQYACLRPCRLPPGVRSPIAGARDIDLIIVRENSEGEYAICGGRLRERQPDEVAIQTAVHTRRGIERILRFGFELAGKRRGHLTMITKSNALRYGMVLWDETLEAVRGEYPGVQTTRAHADAAAMDLVRRPQKFDVIVASNLFGDILSDLSAAIVGGLGLAPSANINPDRRFPSMFEPVHGSAPDIAGKGIANPVAMILSAAMMLDWLGEAGAAAAIAHAVDAALEGGAATADLGGQFTCSQMADCIIDRLRENYI